MGSTRDFLYNLAVHPISNQFISNLQSRCGVKGGEDKSHEKTFWYFSFRFSSMLGEEVYSLIPLIYWIAPDIGASYNLNFGILCLGGQLLKVQPKDIILSLIVLARMYMDFLVHLLTIYQK